MKQNEIKELLVKKFVGKRCNSYSGASVCQIMTYLRDYLKLNHMLFTVKDKKDRASIEYDDCVAGKHIGRSVAHIKIKKQKGEYIRGAYSFGSHYEWIIKDIEVIICDEGQNIDIEDVVNSVMEQAKEEEKSVIKYQELAVKILKDINKTCGEKNIDTWLMIDYIKENYFSLKALLNKDEK